MRAEKERGDARGIGRKFKKRKKAGWGRYCHFSRDEGNKF